MLIEGFYQPQASNAPPAPYVQAVVLCPNITAFRSVRFLVDTGADYTVLSARDVSLLKFSRDSLDAKTRVAVGGLGGKKTWFYTVDATVIFGEPENSWYQWVTRIFICDIWTQPVSDEAWGVPSLLGRDFLNRCQMSANGLKGILHLTPTPGAGLTTLPPVRRI